MNSKERNTQLFYTLAMSALICAPVTLCADDILWNHNCDCVSGDCSEVIRYTAKCNNVTNTFCINNDELPQINSDADRFCGGARGGLQGLADQNGTQFRYNPANQSTPNTCLPKNSFSTRASDSVSGVKSFPVWDA